MRKILLLLIITAMYHSNVFAQCTPVITGNPGATSDYINNFTFGAISNLNSGDAASDYTLYPMTGNYTQGLAYPFTIQTGNPTWGQGLGIWIDFNGNNSFLDAGEFVWASPTSTNTSANILTGNITIPLAASPGVRRMRTACKFANLVTQADECGFNGFGEYEDYNITIVANTPCAGVPNAGTASAAPVNPCPGISVTLNLAGQTLAGGLTYQWVRSATGLPGTYTILPGATTIPYTYIPAAGTTNYYRCIVTCTNAGGGFDTSIASSACTVQAWSPTNNCWCIPTYTNGGTADNIVNVVLGTLTNNTAAAGNPSPYWVDYTPVQAANNLATPVLYIGLASNLTVTHGADPNQFLGVWIDFDHSGTFDATEYFSPNTNAGANGVHVLPITAPVTALAGVTRMRIRGGDDVQMTNAQACGATNSGWGEAEDYLVNVIPSSPHDPAVTAITGAAGNCFSASQNMIVTVTNYGSNPIVVATNPITCTLRVTGPLGVTNYYGNVNPATTLSPYGANTANVLITGVNLYAGGTYYMNTTLSIGNAGGVVNGSLVNDSLAAPITRINYRPAAGPDYHLCQYSNIPFGQGLTVNGCATPINDSVTINFTLAPVTNPTGANVGGARLFASATLPALPPGSTIGNCDYTVTNLATANGGFALETRFPLFSGGIPVNPANVYYASVQGNPGVVPPNYTWTNYPSANVVGNIYNAVGVGGTINMGYHSTWVGNANNNGMTIDAGGIPTVATLKIRYQYVPASFEWYNVPSGGANLYSLSPFNPIITPGSGITNSNTPGTYSFYAACVGSSSCRIPVNLVIDPTPVTYQDTLALCESPAGSNGAIFNLTTMDGPVSGFAAGATVQYYDDQGLFSPVPYPTADTSGTSYVYSKVTNAFGCYSSDTLLLQVNGQPEFPAQYITGNACAPSSIDVATLIDPFTTVPPGSDTLYFSDPACTVPHPNPHNITVSDTVYIVIATNTVPVCSDTAIALIELSTAGALIANQDILNYSIPGFVGCNTFTLSDGNTDTLYNPADCKRIVHITDMADAVSLGSTQVCEWIDASTQVHNGQPYVNRHYQITPSSQTAATVCLYFLDDDFAQFNSFSFINGWPQITPNVNLAISKVDNGDITDPGHTAIAIPNASITTSYDPATTVWTVCFPVDSFSYFYAHAQNPGNVPLPVSLLSFTGKKADGASLLNWVTSSERNNHHFVLERSRDSKTFSGLSGNILSKGVNGNSATALSYDYTDNAPYQGYNYYRLQQTDLDGNVSYSKTVIVYHGNETLVNLYPNPVNTTLNVDINTPKATVAQIRIMDATGRVVRATDMQLGIGSNKGDINLEGLADGVYMVKITSSRGLNFSQSIRKN